MIINPSALLIVAIATVIGALCGATLVGLLVSLVIVFLASVFS
jgi:hypothetical protein